MTERFTQWGPDGNRVVDELTRQCAAADYPGVVTLIQQLVRIPTRGGIDDYGPIVLHIEGWLRSNGLPSRRLPDENTGKTMALVCELAGDHPGPRYVLDACLDTAPFGEPTAWKYAPTSGAIEDGWLYGRGSADSKAAIAIFMHLARHLTKHRSHLHGSLTLLFDADEHTGNFGGAKQFFGSEEFRGDVGGVMIGYPGMEELVIGGRGFLRAEVTVRGDAGHTGSRRTVNNANAVEKAAQLVRILAEERAPAPVDSALDIPPRLTVTGITGGESYSIIPDRCSVNIDVRLTTSFDEKAARDLIENATRVVDEIYPLPDRPTTVDFGESWPAYRLDDNSPLCAALTRAARHHIGKAVSTKVAGPSNIGNYLAKLGIQATAGLGVNYRGLHSIDERIELASIPAIQATYHEAAMTLLDQSWPSL